ncbi:Sapep family Mn(2+)-dependent dipeptidase [Desnuesiella massiliensis]|uniref:Sapep family Mn(2+)-dependent dipeptidase n=1 Tax=Desnuesiella massiliensis TaxID=1650662 RepID=UPI0006E2FC55
MKDKLNEIMEIEKDNLIKRIIELVKIESVEAKAQPGKPFGEGVSKALHKALDIAGNLGFITKDIDGYMGYAQYGEGEDYIGIFGHLDVVEAKEGWNFGPYEGIVKDDRIYGRGVLDNKGPIFAALYGLYAIKKLNINLRYPVRIIFGTNEESGFKDAMYYLSKEKPPIYGFTPDCKYPVVYGERGRTKIALKVKNEKELANKLFEKVNYFFLQGNPNGERLGIDYKDSEFGILEMRNFSFNIEEDELVFKFDISYPRGITIEKILENIREKLYKEIKMEIIKNYNPVVFDKESFLVKSLQKAYEEVTNLDGTPVTTTGGTYAKIIPNIVPFGPSFPGQKGIAHNIDEYMDIEDIVLNAKIYANAVYNLGK